MKEIPNEEQNVKNKINLSNENINSVFDEYKKNKSSSNRDKKEKSNSIKNCFLKKEKVMMNVSESKIFAYEEKNNLPRSESITRTSSKASRKQEIPEIKKENCFEVINKS